MSVIDCEYLERPEPVKIPPQSAVEVIRPVRKTFTHLEDQLPKCDFLTSTKVIPAHFETKASH